MEINEIIKDIVGDPVSENTLIYDSPSETLEPVYFWILDFMNKLFGGKVEKLVDNFTSSPGSGHFSELGGKATRMQDEGMKILGAINTVIKSVINILYDLREFEIRLKHYDDAESSDRRIKEAGILALKQIWMDNVDLKKGRGSINSLSQAELMFSTLRDAFMSTSKLEDIDRLDLNDRVKRILKARLEEYLIWQKTSEKELRKRFEIERTYLKSQVSSLQLYTRWVRPYLRSASMLEMKEYDRNPELVNTFNTILLELSLFGKSKVNIEKEALQEGTLPMPFAEMKFKRDYFSCVLIDFRFRGIPQKIAQRGDYVFGGKAKVIFRGYALNSDQIALLEHKMKESDLENALSLADAATGESLDALKEEIDHYLEDSDKNGKKSEGKSENVNPFFALFGAYNKKEGKSEKKSKEITDKNQIKKDSYVEKVVRKIASDAAKDTSFNIFDVYKKVHGMASYS